MAKIQFMRSSLYNQWDYCQHSTALQYMFGFRSESGVKATLGTITHKALQILADIKLARQDGLLEIHDQELGRFSVDFSNIESLVERAFNYYKKIETHLTLKSSDLAACIAYTNKALSYKGGLVDPRQKTIIATEQYFDFEIQKPWAGGLRMKGTVDLITKINDSIYEVIDYKTGRRLDWATGEEKTEAKLQKDPQLLIYYYALKNLYPDKEFIFSLFFINDGGLFSVCFDDSSYNEAEDMIRRRYIEISSTSEPKLLSYDQSHWKCTRLCQFAKQEYKESGISVCEFMKQSIKAIGLEKSIARYGNHDNIGNYGSGGGTVR